MMAVQDKHRSISVLSWLGWLYLVAVLGLWGVVYTLGDRWWPATVILFAPRWIAALPLAILMPLAAWRSRFSLIPLLLGALIVAGPVVGLNLPFGRSAALGGATLRVITCNIDGIKHDPVALAALIRDSSADVVALQEYPAGLKLDLPPGWQAVQERGLAILSRFPLQRGITTLVSNPPNPWPSTCLLQCIVKTPGGDLNFCSLQLPTPRFDLLPLLDRHTLINPSRKGQLLAGTVYRRRAAQEVQKAVAGLSGPTIIAGDFNMPVESSIYRQVWNGYGNAFSQSGYGYGWTQRAKSRKLTTIGIRIDHILTGPGLEVRGCTVGTDVGSDHLPLIADIEVVKR